MDLTVWFSFVGASLVFGLIPGPSVCFTVAHALKHGAWKTLPSILGQLAANCCQIMIMFLGLNGILKQSPHLFQGLKLGGASYLIYLGCRLWTAAKPQLDVYREGHLKIGRKAFIDGFLVCGTNPKAILYYAALLPQFVSKNWDEKAQMLILAMTNLLIALLVLGFYTLLADRVRRWISRPTYWRAQNRLTGTIMIGAGITLLLASLEWR